MMTDDTDTPAPVEPRHREAARRWRPKESDQWTPGTVFPRDAYAAGLARGEQEGRRLAGNARARLLAAIVDWAESGDVPQDKGLANVLEGIVRPALAKWRP